MTGQFSIGRTRTWRGLAAGLALAALSLGLALPLAGCAGWNTWPPQKPGSGVPSRDDVNVVATMRLALSRVIADYPPRGAQDQAVAINLPQPLVSEQAYRRIARDVEREFGVDRPVSPLASPNAGLPVYHVAAVRIRTNRAEIDVLRPIFGPGAVDRPELTNDQAYEGYTVRLSGGFKPWQVTWVDRYSPGIIPAPALNFIDRQAPEPEVEPEPESDDEAEPETPAEPEETPDGG